MKEKIVSSKIVQKIKSWKVWQKLSGHPVLRKIFCYETIAYLIAGILTTVVNYLVYFFMPRFPSEGFDVILANTVAFIAAVIFAFFANKIFVFNSPSWDLKTLVREFFPFVGCRVLSWLFETVFLYVTVSKLGFNDMLMKILAGIVVFILNYLAGKFLIFRKPAAGKETENGPASET